MAGKCIKERGDIYKAKELLENIRQLFALFNSPSLIHMKYMNLHIYVIKRMTSLVLNPEDYNPEGCGADFFY